MRPRRYKLRLFWQRVPRNEFAQLRVPSFARRIFLTNFPRG
ncbi:unnamed protein product, partial [Pelagomonas calceolata]